MSDTRELAYIAVSPLDERLNRWTAEVSDALLMVEECINQTTDFDSLMRIHRRAVELQYLVEHVQKIALDKAEKRQ